MNSILWKQFYISTKTVFCTSHIRCGSSLRGRDIVDPQNIFTSDLKAILWSALDLKSRLTDFNNKQYNYLQGRHITVLLSEPDAYLQAVTTRASAHLGACSSTIVDNVWEKLSERDIEDLGRTVSTASDIILVSGQSHCNIKQLANGAIIPVVELKSLKFAMLYALADIMTMYEHHKLLSPLTVSWVGPVKPLLNAYLYILPKLKMDLKFCCHKSLDNPFSPTLLHAGIENSIKNNTSLQHCSCATEAVYRTDVIVTTGHDIATLSISCKDAEEASLEYILLHDMPRGELELEGSLFSSEHNSMWKSKENFSWIVMAVLMRLLGDKPTLIPEPKWELE